MKIFIEFLSGLMGLIVLAGVGYAVALLVYSIRSREADGSHYGWASWYGEGYRGRVTASSEIFNPDAMTCACNLFPFGTTIRVKVYERPQYVDVRINDRMSPDWTEKGRIVDLSEAAFKRLVSTDQGLVRVSVSVLEKSRGAPLGGTTISYPKH